MTDFEDDIQETPETGSEEKFNEAELKEAKDLGWAPREKWRGKPEDFIEAPEFLRRARENLPIVRSLLDKEKQERLRDKTAFDARVADFERRLAAQDRMHRRNMDLQRAQIIEQFEGEKRAALAINDPGERQRAFDAATRRERDAIHRVARTEETDDGSSSAAPAAPPPPPREVIEWGNRNPWFMQNPYMAQEAAQVMQGLEYSDPDLPLSDKLDRVTETIRDRYPEWFPGSAAPSRTNGAGRSSIQAVEGSRGQRVATSSRAKSTAQLPPEARAAFADIYSRGMYGKAKPGEDPAKHKAQAEKRYSQTYWEEYSDE